MRVISIPFMVLTLVAGSEILARETDGTDTTDGTQEENLNIGGKTWGGSLEDEPSREHPSESYDNESKGQDEIGRKQADELYLASLIQKGRDLYKARQADIESGRGKQDTAKPKTVIYKTEQHKLGIKEVTREIQHTVARILAALTDESRNE